MPKTRTVSVTLDGPIFDGFSIFSRMSDKERDNLYSGMATFLKTYMAKADLQMMVGSIPKTKIPVMFEKHKINDEYTAYPYGVLDDIDMMEILDDTEIS